MKNDNIIMIDWAGNILFEGDRRSPEVDRVLDANRCPYCEDWDLSGVIDNPDECVECENTSYIGEFEVFWEDEKRKDNVYEFINY